MRSKVTCHKTMGVNVAVHQRTRAKTLRLSFAMRTDNNRLGRFGGNLKLFAERSEMFAPSHSALGRLDGTQGGRPPFDSVMTSKFSFLRRRTIAANFSSKCFARPLGRWLAD